MSELTADVARNEYGQLIIRFEARGKIGDVVIPPPVRYAARADNLWMTTCFEAFAMSADGDYFEFNFSPSTCWAAYHFSSYREGMTIAHAAIPHISIEHARNRIALTARLSLRSFMKDWPERLALSAVIEEKGGAKSYWALAHPPGRPDFHHKDCFALTLAPPGAA